MTVEQDVNKGMPVVEQLGLLRKNSPAADIITEIVRINENGLCLVSARIVEPDQEADGTAVITTSGFGWASDPETAEDRAIARALAHAGYGSGKLLEPARPEAVVPASIPEAEPEAPQLDEDDLLTASLVEKVRHAQVKAKWEDGRCMFWIRNNLGEKSIVTGDPWSGSWNSVIAELNVGQARRLVAAMRSGTS